MPYIGARLQELNTANSLTVNGDASVTGTVNPSGDTASGDAAAVGFTSAEGLILTGQGSTNDITIKNDADADVLEIPTGTTNVTIAGNLGVGGTVTGTGTSVFASLDISGDIDVDGTTNLDVVDIDGAVDMASTLQVDGAITSSSSATITTTGNEVQLTLKSTDADAVEGPTLDLIRDSASPAASDNIGLIRYIGEDSAGNATVYAEIHGQIENPANGSEDAAINFEIVKGSGRDNSFKIGADEVVVNEASRDVDFRVESDDNANMLFVDAANDRVGIGTNSPSVELEIAGAGEMLRLQSSDTNKASIRAIQSGGGDRWQLGTLDSNDSVTLQASNSTGELIFETGGATERARISSSGRMSIGTTSTAFRFNVVSNQSDYVAQFDRNVDIDGNFRNHIKFSRGGTAVGEILTSQSATQYGTSSDHRLKENVEGMTGAIARVKQLSPKRFSWIVDDLDAPNFDGFLAHEAQAIVPQAVSGTHNNVDEDGNPVMQGIDHSMMVPLLTGALQEAIAEIETLKTKVAALEGE